MKKKLLLSKDLFVFAFFALASAGLLVYYGLQNFVLPGLFSGWLGLCIVLNFSIIPVGLALLNDKTGFMQAYKKAIKIAKIIIAAYSAVVIPLSIIIVVSLLVN